MNSKARVSSFVVWLALVGCEAGETEGVSPSGGITGAGGQQAAGSAGASVGGVGSGGTKGTGGTTASGGSTATGGNSSATGGASGNGGSVATGGTPGTGGTTVSGGSAGAGVGGAVTGGAMSSGGASGAGAGAANGGGAGTGGNTGGTAGSAGTGPTFHVFLLLGQSNMAGYAKADAADKVEDERIRVLGFDACAETGRQEGAWDVAVPPLHECWNGAVGPGDHFSKTLVEMIPPGDSIGLVPCAISGERIETFLKVGGDRYDWIVQRARLAQDEGGVIEGILFHQGESNNGDSTWPGKVNTLVTDLRADLGLGNVPFLAGELARGGACAGHNTLVNMLPGVVSNAHVVSAEGLGVDPADTQWNVHFGHDETVTFGQRFAATMIEALGW